MITRTRGRRLAISAAIGASIAFTPACAVHHGRGAAYSSCWYEDAGIALLAVGVLIVAACTGGHGWFHGHYGYGYHSGWHCR